MRKFFKKLWYYILNPQPFLKQYSMDWTEKELKIAIKQWSKIK